MLNPVQSSVSSALMFVPGSYAWFPPFPVDADHVTIVKTILDKYMQENGVSILDMCFHCKALGNYEEGSDFERRLLRCNGCQLVAYCNSKCQRRDWTCHKFVCREFPVVNYRNVLYNTGSWVEHLVELRKRASRLPKAEVGTEIFQNPRVCHNCWGTRFQTLKLCKCACVTYCSESCANADELHKQKCEHFQRVLCLSYPMNIINALSEASKRLSHGNNEFSLDKTGTLTIHVVDSGPIFNSRAWEAFMGYFPKLEKLNVFFVVQGKGFYPWFILNCPNSLKKNNAIKYSVQQMEYHMFFSSKEYTEPDVVVVFDSSNEMSQWDEDDAIHSEMSYRNMVFSTKTILILMDGTEELLKCEVKDVNEAQSVFQLVPPQINPIKEVIFKEEPEINCDIEFLNEKLYFTCLKRS